MSTYSDKNWMWFQGERLRYSKKKKSLQSPNYFSFQHHGLASAIWEQVETV